MVDYNLAPDVISTIKEIKEKYDKPLYNLIKSEEDRCGIIRVKNSDPEDYPTYELKDGAGGDVASFNMEDDCVKINDEIELNTDDDIIAYLDDDFDVTENYDVDKELYDERRKLSDGVNSCHKYEICIWNKKQDELAIILEDAGFVDFEQDEYEFIAFNHNEDTKIIIPIVKFLDSSNYRFERINK